MSLPDSPGTIEPDEPSQPTPTANAPLPQPLLTGAKMDALPPYTPQDWLMFALGTLIGLASIMIPILGTAILAVIFFIKQSPRSPILRGIGLGIAIVSVVLVGGLVLCFGALGVSSLQSRVR